MKWNLEQWIESVREKPEEVRMRYVFACVAISMAVVVSLWLLGVNESFQTVATDATEENGAMNAVLPKPGDLSLDALLNNDGVLGGEQTEATGSQYFEEQLEQKAIPRYDDEGLAPVDRPETQP